MSSASPLVPNTPSPPQTSPLQPTLSPSPRSKVITTVLETGSQPPPTSNATPTQDILETLCATPSDNAKLSSGLNEIAPLASTTVTLPEVDHLIDTLQNFTSQASGTNGLDSDIAVSSAPLQLNPVVSINEDSSSELLASIMGLTTAAQTVTLPSVSDTQVISDKPSTDVIQELSTGIAGCCSVSFSTTSLIDMLSRPSTEPASTFVTCTTTSSSLFNENTNDVLMASTSEKAYLSPPHSSATILASPQSSPFRMTSPVPEHQWLNGEVGILN